MSKAGVRSSLLLGCLLFLAASARSQTAFRVSDLDSGPNPQTASSSPGELTTFKGKVFFAATEASSGRELWVSDGSGTGTRLLADFCPGECSSNPLILGTTRSAMLGVASQEVWRSDGTREGTFPLRSGGERIRASYDSDDFPLAVFVGNVLYFEGCTTATGCELWRSDGTLEGTSLVRDTAPGQEHGYLGGLTAVGNRVFFVTYRQDAVLWTTNGTTAGTTRVASFNGSIRTTTTVLGDKLLFLFVSQYEQDALWVSDGTPSGTRPLTHFTVESPFRQTLFLKTLGGKAYFVADDVVHGAEIWASDGTPGGTKRVTEFGYFDPFHGDQPFFEPEGLRASDIELLGDRLVFWATDGLTGFQPWATRGTPESTEPLCPGCSFTHSRANLVKVGGKVVFAGGNAEHGAELWASDGSARGTALVRDLCPGPCSGALSPPTLLLGAAFFRTISSERGGSSELWRSDGTPAGTRRFASLGPHAEGFLPPELAALDRTVFYGGFDGDHRVELWASDGTAGGTRLVADINGGIGSSSLGDLTPSGERLYFADCRNPSRLWRTQGNPDTAVQASDLIWRCPAYTDDKMVAAGGSVFFADIGSFAGPAQLWRLNEDGSTSQLTSLPDGHNAGDLFAFQDRLLFLVYTGFERPIELWRSDGTAQGTVKVVELPARLTYVRSQTVVRSEVWFLASDQEQRGSEVWKTDGTPAGTRVVADLGNRGAREEARFTEVGATVFFLAGDEDFNPQIWKTDGTQEGTSLVRDLDPEPEDDFLEANPSDLTVFQGSLYFFAATALYNRGLWRSDGTPAGTVLLAEFVTEGINELDEPPYPPVPTGLAVVGGKLVFAADDGVHGREIWRSDGTAAGTRLLADLFPGDTGSGASGFRTAAGKRYFSAHDGLHGFELWRTDGTEAGTRLVQDIAPLGASSHPGQLTVAGDKLFFAANDGASGEEIWALPLSGPACPPSATALCLGDGRFRVEVSWRDFSGNTGSGQAVKLTNDTGYFWFFSPENVEVVLKVLDGQGVNGHHWIFYGALSNVEYTLTVTDTRTGLARRYFNPAGRLASVGDTTGFGPLGAYSTTKIAEAGAPPGISGSAGPSTGACVPGARRLCLNGGRFAVEASWKDFSGRTGAGTAVSLTGDTGYFWFFDAANVEAVVKVLDGRPVNGHHWVFYGALSNVEYTLTVTDTMTGAVKTYKNPSGRFASVADTGAF